MAPAPPVPFEGHEFHLTVPPSAQGEMAAAGLGQPKPVVALRPPTPPKA